MKTMNTSMNCEDIKPSRHLVCKYIKTEDKKRWSTSIKNVNVKVIDVQL